MGAVPGQRVHPGADVEALAVQCHPAAAGAVALDGAPRGARGLVADKQHIVARVTEHRFQVVDDATARAHAAGGNHDRRPVVAAQVVHHALMVGVAVHGEQLGEIQRVPTRVQAFFCLCIPEPAQAAVAGGEVGRQRRIQHHREVLPLPLPGCPRAARRALVHERLQFVQQLLGAADAEGGNQDGAAVGEGVFNQRSQALMALLALLMQAAPVGTFQYHRVRALRRRGVRQQRCVGRTEVTGEQHTANPAIFQPFTFNIGGAENMSRVLQAQPQAGLDFMPSIKGQGQQPLPQQRDDPVQQLPVAGHADLDGVLQYHRQQLRAGFAADDGPAKSGRQQVRHPPNVVDMHVGHDQRTKVVDGEADLQLPCPAAIAGGFVALEQAAIDQ